MGVPTTVGPHLNTSMTRHPSRLPDTTISARRRTVSTALLGVVLALGLLVAAPTAASAQDAPAAAAPQTWTLKPATAGGPDARAHLVHDVTPGQTISDFVSVTNFSDTPLHLDVYGGDAFTPQDGGYDLLARDKTSVDVGAWISLGRTVLDLAPQETAVIPVTIQVPGNATPGDHSGGIVAALVTTATDATGQQVTVENRVGARVYLRVEGEVAPRLDVTDLSSSYAGTLNPAGQGSVDVTYTVVNSGNVRLSGTQTVEVSGLFGLGRSSVTLSDIPELLPGASIEVAGTVDGVWPTGRVTTEVTVQPVDPRGTVTVEPTTASTAGWALPWGVLAALLILVGAVVTFRHFARQGPTAPNPTSGGAGATTGPHTADDAISAIVPDEAPTPAAAGSGTAGTDPRSS